MLKTLDGSIISLIILIFIFIVAYNRSTNVLAPYKTFLYLVLLNMVLISVDLLTWFFNGRAGTVFLICSKIFNAALFVLEPIAASLCVIYIYSLISYEENKLKRIKSAIYIIFMLNAALTLISLHTGWYFYLDRNQVYHRGDYFFIHEILCSCLFFYSFYFICRNKKSFDKKYFFTMLFFFVPQSIGIIIQLICYGYTTIWIGMTLSLLIAYFNIQSQGLNTDYLTGVNNRRYLDQYIASKIRNSIHKTFAALMIDIDNFKSINDNYGHEIGDLALKDAVQIIKSSLRRDDFVARMGGDEFIVVIDIHSGQSPDFVVRRIMENIEKFNTENIRPYKLSFSIGFYVYDVASKMTSADLICHIDKLMYDNKKMKPAH